MCVHVSFVWSRGCVHCCICLCLAVCVVSGGSSRMLVLCGRLIYLTLFDACMPCFFFPWSQRSNRSRRKVETAEFDAQLQLYTVRYSQYHRRTQDMLTTARFVKAFVIYFIRLLVPVRAGWVLLEIYWLSLLKSIGSRSWLAHALALGPTVLRLHSPRASRTFCTVSVANSFCLLLFLICPAHCLIPLCLSVFSGKSGLCSLSQPPPMCLPSLFTPPLLFFPFTGLLLCSPLCSSSTLHGACPCYISWISPIPLLGLPPPFWCIHAAFVCVFSYFLPVMFSFSLSFTSRSDVTGIDIDPTHLAALNAMFVCIKGISDALLMNEVELSVWSLYLESLNSHWVLQRPPDNMLRTLLFSAFATKINLTPDSTFLLPYLKGVVPDFMDTFRTFASAKPTALLHVPSAVLNQRYSLLQDIAYAVSINPTLDVLSRCASNGVYVAKMEKGERGGQQQQEKQERVGGGIEKGSTGSIEAEVLS